MSVLIELTSHNKTILEEMNEKALEEELQLRLCRRNAGHCDYCDRSPSTPPCKFPTRHRDERIWTPEVKEAFESRPDTCDRCQGIGRLTFLEGHPLCDCVKRRITEVQAKV